jgi:hypothetical protein
VLAIYSITITPLSGHTSGRSSYRLLRHLSAARWLTEHELDPQLDVLMALRLI